MVSSHDRCTTLEMTYMVHLERRICARDHIYYHREDGERVGQNEDGPVLEWIGERGRPLTLLTCVSTLTAHFQNKSSRRHATFHVYSTPSSVVVHSNILPNSYREIDSEEALRKPVVHADVEAANDPFGSMDSAPKREDSVARLKAIERSLVPFARSESRGGDGAPEPAEPEGSRRGSLILFCGEGGAKHFLSLLITGMRVGCGPGLWCYPFSSPTRPCC